MSFLNWLFPNRQLLMGEVDGQVQVVTDEDKQECRIVDMRPGQTGVVVNWLFSQGSAGHLWVYSYSLAKLSNRSPRPWEVLISRTADGIEVCEGVVRTSGRGSGSGGPGSLPVMRLAEGVSVEVDA